MTFAQLIAQSALDALPHFKGEGADDQEAARLARDAAADMWADLVKAGVADPAEIEGIRKTRRLAP